MVCGQWSHPLWTQNRDAWLQQAASPLPFFFIRWLTLQITLLTDVVVDMIALNKWIDCDAWKITVNHFDHKHRQWWWQWQCSLTKPSSVNSKGSTWPLNTSDCWNHHYQGCQKLPKAVMKVPDILVDLRQKQLSILDFMNKQSNVKEP